LSGGQQQRTAIAPAVCHSAGRSAPRISTFTVERGAWPPASNELFMERDALGLMNAQVGQTVIVNAPDGTPTPMSISGAVHDPGLSPATQEDSEYGYIASQNTASTAF
jgi:putative ABC transport system permease protein